MKSLFTLAVLSLSLSASAFQIQANCNFNSAQGSCAVFNQWATPIYCSLQANGQVSSGMAANAWENVTVYPGSYAYVYVNANNPMMDPLVFVNGSADCQF